MNPTTCDTAYFGGIAIIMWTWSDSRCPSSMRLSFCVASLRKTSPKCWRSCPYNVLRRHFGINTTWYLHSQTEWLRLSNVSIGTLPFVCLAAHEGSLYGGHTPENVKLLPPPPHSRGASLRPRVGVPLPRSSPPPPRSRGRPPRFWPPSPTRLATRRRP